MASTRRLLDLYLPPSDEMTLESFVATTYKVDWDFVEEELLPVALGVRTPVSRERAFRAELERRLERADVTVLYDLAATERRTRRSPWIDPVPVVSRKLHAKVSLLLWSAPTPGDGARRWARLIVGSANMTRPGFRENYEVLAALDFGVPGGLPGGYLSDAVTLIRRIAGGAAPTLLASQLERFERVARPLVGGKMPAGLHPWQVVDGDRMLAAMEDGWKDVGEAVPEEVIVVSPFWPEGEEPAKAVALLVRRFGMPERVVLVCQTATEVAGGLVPILPNSLAVELKRDLGCRVVIRPALLDYGVDYEVATASGDDTEDEHVSGTPAGPATIRRDLHAKCLAIRGRRASLLYIGSANCTRRGLGLGAAANWEAGLIYRLAGRETRVIDEILRVAGRPIEVHADRPPRTQPPVREPDPPAPTFLEEVVGQETTVTVRSRERSAVPPDLIVLMPDHRDPDRYFLILRRKRDEPVANPLVARLEECALVDPHLTEVDSEGLGGGLALMPWVEVRWGGNAALFPVRFDDKTALPRVIGMRRYTERELLDYFLHGREPSGGDGGGGDGTEGTGANEQPIDTRRILSYFIRRFVEAIPGLEADVSRALHSSPAVRATLRGSTGALELAETAIRSFRQGPARDEPIKTATAVGFQLVEITAALRRCRQRATAPEVRDALTDAIGQCLGRLDELAQEYPELTSGLFARYRGHFVGDGR